MLIDSQVVFQGLIQKIET